MDFEVTEKEYKELEIRYSHALNTAMGEIKNIIDDIQENAGRAVFYKYEARIKTLESLREKCNRKQLPANKIEDIAGIKIVCLFEDDIEILDERLSESFAEKSVDNYLKSPKENGYRGVHRTITVETTVRGRKKYLPVEIQIKTALTDALWSMEHVVRYKNAHPDPSAGEIVKKAAESVAKLEQDMIKFRDYKPENDNTKPAE